MKVFTKIGITFLLVVFTTGMLWAQHSASEVAAKMATLNKMSVNTQFSDLDPNAKAVAYPASDAMFDLQWEMPVGVGGGEAGIETDGTDYIYTSKWNGAGEFYKYDIDGNYIDVFTIAGSTGCRDIAYDGTYFYGSAASTTVFQMDFGTATMVSTFTAPTPVRAIAYNEDDGWFYANNWSTDIYAFDMTGASMGSWAVGASAASYYGMAYDNYSTPGTPYLWGYSQTGATLNQLIQMELPAGTETGLTFDVGSVLSSYASAGGLATSDGLVAGTYSFVGTSQNINIWALELAGGSTPEYCDATTTNEDEYIANVLCGDIDNTSDWQGGVADYTAISTTIAAGESEDMLVTNGNAWASDIVYAWVDWNMNYEFDQGTDEEFMLTNVGGTGQTFTGAIAVPAGTAEGDYRMRIRMTYSTAPLPCGNASYGEIEDYTITVSAGGTTTASCEDFDALTPGDYVALELGGNWTTWSGSPGTAEDAIVSDMYSTSPSNSILVEGTTDLVHLITGDNITSGVWSYNFNIYIPDGTTGYFNLQKDVVPGTEWGFQVMFEDDMTIVVDGGGAGAAIIPYDYDTWYFIETVVDLDADWCQFYIDGTLEHEYQWTLGTFGTAGALTLAGSNLYANPGAGGTPPGAHFDDICFVELPSQSWAMPQNVMAVVENDYDVHVSWDAPGSGDPIGYNVLRDDENIAYVTAPTMEYDDMGLEEGTYTYCVTAVYDGGESGEACADPVTIIVPLPPGPINLTGTATVTTGNPIDLMWEAPGGGEWIHWDAGVNNGNGIGLTNGGTFSCASRWYPGDLGPYNGLSLLTVNFFANGDPDATYVIKVWTGANGTTEVYSQAVASFNVDDWNEVDLTTPVVISAAEDFWFGYEVTHAAGMFPAGTDDGPAVPYNGDMISTGGGWVSMSTDYGLDYNWNIQGWVALADGKGVTPTTKLVKPVATSTDFAASGSTGISNKFVPTADNSKELDSYNVYRSINGAAFSVIGNTAETEYTDEDVTVVGIYDYYVTAVWDPEGESGPSNTWTVDVQTSIEDMIFNSTMVYPNPASEVVNIKSAFDITSVKVFNHSGQVVAEEMVHNKMYQFNTSQYTSGMYFFQIETSEGTISKRIIVQ